MFGKEIVLHVGEEMIIQLKDIDDWKAADFVRYMKSQCSLKGIEYSANQKQSFMILGRAFKLLKLNNKSKIFINYLLRTLPKKLNDNTIKNLPKITTISDETKRKLIMLRSV
jgi:hypothetical protein